MELQKNPCDHWTLTHRTSKEAPGKKIWWGKSYKCVSINISPFACLPSSEDQSSIFCAPKLFITTETLGTERKVNACGDPKWFTWELAGERVCWERKKKKSLWGMVFRVLGHIRARGEDVTPLTKWRKSREERKTDCRKCSHWHSSWEVRKDWKESKLDWGCSAGWDWTVWSLRATYVTENLLTPLLEPSCHIAHCTSHIIISETQRQWRAVLPWMVNISSCYFKTLFLLHRCRFFITLESGKGSYVASL